MPLSTMLLSHARDCQRPGESFQGDPKTLEHFWLLKSRLRISGSPELPKLEVMSLEARNSKMGMFWCFNDSDNQLIQSALRIEKSFAKAMCAKYPLLHRIRLNVFRCSREGHEAVVRWRTGSVRCLLDRTGRLKRILVGWGGGVGVPTYQ